MKPTKLMALGTLLLLGVSVASAQSLGDYAKNIRKSKADTATASHHFDNDNLPTSEGGLSVVGPQPTDDKTAAAATTTAAAKDPAADATASAADRQKAADEWKDKLAKQQDKIASLNHELDLDQREIRLRAAAVYSDPAIRGRDAADWDKQDLQYKNEIDEKQKAIADARQKLDELQEQARKAGIKPKDDDSSNSNNDKK